MNHLIFRFFKNSIKLYTIAVEIFDHLYQIFDDSNRRINALKAYRRLKQIESFKDEQIVCSSMLDIENVTNFEIEKSNSRESTSNERIRKICIKSIQLIDEHASICFQNKLHVIKIKMNLFSNFKNITTFFFCDVVFFFAFDQISLS